MDLIGTRIVHKSKHFSSTSMGEGVITDFDGKLITIVFDNGASKKLDLCTVIKAVIVQAIDSEIQQKIIDFINTPVPLPKPRPTPIPGFGVDYHSEYLKTKPTLTYQEVEKLFGIQISGFGRGINPTAPSVILISVIEKKKDSFVYHDRWTADGDYIYSGEGKSGDQSMTRGNAAILNAKRDNKKIDLLVKFSSDKYIYQGVFELVDYEYVDDKGEDGLLRKEYKFRLRKVSD